ncbi:MAG: ankyrin repeat domain-containing protein [Synergistaceae bacterium]|nr:ankyrin repeat domain-containing protein [Synergistaceae bacterium]
MTQDEFVELCADGNYTQITEAIHSGIDPNKAGRLKGNPILPIFVAASAGNKDAIRALAENGTNCADGFTAATIGQRMSIANLLVKCGADINALDSSGHTAILTAVTMNRPDLLDDLIYLGGDVNVKSEADHNALTYAAMMASSPEHGELNPKIVSLLMENGAEYYDAMMLALKTGNSEFARLLIQGGADVNRIDEDGRSFVMYAVMIPADSKNAQETSTEFLRTLLENGADPDIPDSNGRTPLMIAAIDEELDEGIIDTLLEFGADIDAQDKKGLTALMWAVAGVDRSPNLMMPALIRTGGLRAEGWEKWCAFMSLFTAAKHGLQIDIVRRLIEHGADVNVIDSRGMNAIMYALMNGDDETADILSDAGAQINFDLT